MADRFDRAYGIDAEWHRQHYRRGFRTAMLIVLCGIIAMIFATLPLWIKMIA